VKSVRVRGVEAMDTPFDFGMNAREIDGIEVLLSPAAAAISATVTPADSASAAFRRVRTA
jgi:hypothetical protein